MATLQGERSDRYFRELMKRRGVDDADLVRARVGHEKKCPIVRQGHAPRPHADCDLGDDFRMVERHDTHARGARIAHVETVLGRIEKQRERMIRLAQLDDALRLLAVGTAMR